MSGGKFTAGRNETLWCTVCGVRLTDDETKGWGCPKCGNQGVPCSTEMDVCVEVNWHELRILIIWAENWAAQCARSPKATERDTQLGKVVTAIAYRLQKQFPDLGALTLSGEIAALPSELKKRGVEIGNIETNIDRPKPVSVNGPGAVGHAKAAIARASGDA